jgi:hypothetical protein
MSLSSETPSPLQPIVETKDIEDNIAGLIRDLKNGDGPVRVNAIYQLSILRNSLGAKLVESVALPLLGGKPPKALY